MDEVNYRIEGLRAPAIDKRTFDGIMHESQGMEEAFAECFDPK